MTTDFMLLYFCPYKDKSVRLYFCVLLYFCPYKDKSTFYTMLYTLSPKVRASICFRINSQTFPKKILQMSPLPLNILTPQSPAFNRKLSRIKFYEN